MGNKPSEYNGVNCCECRVSLPACKTWDGFKRELFPEWGNCYNFLNGRYFRPENGGYRCPRCFYNRVRDAEAKRRKQEEEKRKQAAEEERQRRKEEEKRQAIEAERKRREEEWKRKEERWEKKQQLLEEYKKQGNTISKSYLHRQEESLNETKEKVMKGTSTNDTMGLPEDESRSNKVDISLRVSDLSHNTTNSSFQDLVDIVDSGALEHWNESYVLALNPTIVEAYLLMNKDINPEAITEVFSHLECACPPNETLYLTKAILYACASSEGNEIKVNATQKALQTEISNIKDILMTDKHTNIAEASFVICISEAIIAQPQGLGSTILRKCISYLVQMAIPQDNTITNELRNATCDMVQYITWSVQDIVKFLNFVFMNDKASVAAKILRSVLAYSIPYVSIMDKHVLFSDLVPSIDVLIENQCNLSLSKVIQELKDKGDISPQVIALVEQVVKKTVQLNSSTDSSENIGCLTKRFTMDNALDVLPDILHVLCSVNKDINGWFPRVTQLVSLSLLVLTSEKQRGRLLEIATGEGKSCIVAMFAVIMAKRNQKVDIITSSPVLAERDAEEWASFYKCFNVSIDTNARSSIKTAKHKQSCYQNDVIYGTVGTFAGDILQQEFSMEETRGSRSFDVVIVDEVDLMTLDQGVQFTYLSHNMVGVRHIEPVLALTWSMISQHAAVIIPGDVTMFAAKPLYLFDAIIQSVPIESEFESSADLVNLGIGYESFDKETGVNLLNTDASAAEHNWAFFDLLKMTKFIHLLERHLDVTFVLFHIEKESETIELLQEPQIVEGQQTVFFLLSDGGVARPLYDMDEVAESTYYMVNDIICYGKQMNDKINIPEYLKEYVHDRLPAFIKNAFMAMGMVNNREYLAGEKEIYPISFKSSGVIERNKKWGDGLQQFLEMKHFCRLSTTSLVTNFMSNLGLFKCYAGFLGVSGTLGEQEEIEFLQDYYNIEVAAIPTHKPKKRYETDALFRNNKEEWENEFCCQLERQLSSHPSGLPGRAALVICEDIKTAIATETLVKERVTETVFLYTKRQDANVLNRKFGPGDVVVATNLAGRGTNIKVTDEVNLSGGLFVLVTFLPMNRRVELQAFGRTARKGAPGSAIIVALGNDENEHWRSIKQKRKEKEKRRLVDMIEYDVTEVELQEHLFKVYCSFLKNAYEQYDEEGSEETIIAPLNENWGLWLQRHADDIETGQKQKLDESLEKELNRAKDRIQRRLSPSGNVYHLINFANRVEDHGKAIEAYNRATNEDPHWTAIAYYNKAARRIKLKDQGYMDDAIGDLQNAEKLLRNEVNNMATTLLVITETGPSNVKETALQNDFQTRQEIMAAYIENVTKAISKLQELKSKGDDAMVEESHVVAVVQRSSDYAFEAMIELKNRGLERVYEVKKKPPPFSIGGLIVCLIGVLEIVVGAVLCATGLFASFGLGLIAEGVSDVIYGIEAMVTGEFSWAEWGIQKAISIAVSLLTAGVGGIALKAGRAVSSVVKPMIKMATSGLSKAWKATKGVFLKISGKSLAAGSKSVKALYNKAGKVMIGTYKGSKNAMTAVKNKLCNSGFKTNLNPVAKKIGDIAKKPVIKTIANQVIEQGFNKLFNCAWDGLLDYLYEREKAELTKKLKPYFYKSLDNGTLKKTFEDVILCTVPNVFLQDGEIHKIQSNDINDFYSNASGNVAADVASRGDGEEFIASAIKEFASGTINEASNAAKTMLNQADNLYEANMKSLQKKIYWAEKLVAGCDALYQLSQMTVTIVKLKTNFENLLDKTVESEFEDKERNCNTLPAKMRTLPYFDTLKNEVASSIAKAYSEQMINVVKNGIGSVVKNQMTTKFSDMTKSYAGRLTNIDAAMRGIVEKGRARVDVMATMKNVTNNRQSVMKPGTVASDVASRVRALVSHVSVETNLLGKVSIKSKSMTTEASKSPGTDTEMHPPKHVMDLLSKQSTSSGGFPAKEDLPQFASMLIDLESSVLRTKSSAAVAQSIAKLIHSNDNEKALQMSFISTFPVNISVDSSKSPSNKNWLTMNKSDSLQLITPEDTIRYHQDGYRAIVHYYESENVIDSDASRRLIEWITRAAFADPQSPEVKEIHALSNRQ